MLKLLNTYVAKPTLDNAKRIRDYDRKHPMASCMLSPAESNILADAIHHANKGS
jgi:hypothetical protein